jgi:predicted metalloendopeptidase
MLFSTSTSARRLHRALTAAVATAAVATAAFVAPLAPAWAASPVLAVDPAYMDAQVDPCQDYYGFANGAYERVAIPPAFAAYGVNQEIDERTRDLLKAILDSAALAKAAAGSPTQRIGDFYASGLDQAGIERAGLAPIAELLDAVAAYKDPAQLPLLMALLHRAGVRAGWSVYVGPDEKDSASVTVNLAQGGLGLPDRDYYLRADADSAKLRGQYTKHIQAMLQLAGEATATAQFQAQAVVALETAMAQASKTLVQLRDPQGNYHRMDRKALAALSPRLFLTTWLKAVGVPEAQSHVVVGQPEYLSALSKLVKGGKIADWRAYLRWQVLRAYAPYLGQALERESFGFYGQTLAGRTEQLPRWKRVLQALDQGIGMDLGRLYVDQAFSPRAKAKVLEMIRFHQTALRASIARATWMGEATKVEARRKVDTLVAMVGYPDEWRDYSALQIRRDSYAGNYLASQRFDWQRDLAKLGKPVDRKDWQMTPQTNNAYYDPTMNQIVLPAGILQPPFFDVDADDASNYGALASTIGHEILHALDDQGSQYDADGNLKNWWTAADRTAYDAATAKVVAQYNGYQVAGLAINGQQTLGENLADIGGVKIAWEAYKLAGKGKPASPAKTVAGRLISDDQRFFVAFAQSWRTNERLESQKLKVQSDVHSPVRWRVHGPGAALEIYSRAFGCATGQAMFAEPARRFELW